MSQDIGDVCPDVESCSKRLHVSGTHPDVTDALPRMRSPATTDALPRMRSPATTDALPRMGFMGGFWDACSGDRDGFTGSLTGGSLPNPGAHPALEAGRPARALR